MLQRGAGQLHHTEEPDVTLSSGTVSHQALDILISQQRCDAEPAFQLLGPSANGAAGDFTDVATDVIPAIGGTPPCSGRSATHEPPDRDGETEVLPEIAQVLDVGDPVTEVRTTMTMWAFLALPKVSNRFAPCGRS